MILYIEKNKIKSQITQEYLLELMSWAKLQNIILIYKNSVVFLYTLNKQFKMKQKTVSYIIPSQRIKHLWINLTKEVKICTVKVKVLVTQSCLTLCKPLWPGKLFCPWSSPGKNTGVGCHFLLQGIFPTQKLNPGLMHCRQTLLSEPPGQHGIKTDIYINETEMKAQK